MTGEKTSVHKPLLSWRRDRQRTRALVGRKRGLHHPEGLTNSDSNAHVFSKSLRATFVNGAIDLTKERGVYNLYVRVAGGDGNVGQAVDASPNDMEVDESGSRASGGASAGETRKTEGSGRAFWWW